MKILILCSAVITALAEPPVNNRYLPPGQGQGFSGGFGGPSQTYGPPGLGNGFGSQRQTDAVFRGQPSSSYGAPSFNSRQSTRPSSQFGSRTPSSQYGAPNRGQGPASQVSGLTQGTLQAPSSQYGAPGFNQGSQIPSSQYGTPGFNRGSQAPSSQYGAPGFNQGSQAPSSQYGAPGRNQGNLQSPSSRYGAPGLSQGSQAPSSQYGAPGLQGNLQAPSSQYGAPGFGRQQARPSQQYGAPGISGVGGGQFSQNSLRPDVSQGYLPPAAGGNTGNGGYAGDDGSNGEPANYSFEYMVKDEPSGNDFGHRESRQGDRAEGLYYVLLPDGRKQTVQYEADENGYKPRISYEDTGLGLGGYDRNSQGNFGKDYQNQGGYQ